MMVWWHQRGMKDAALVQVFRRCETLGLQLLDDTVQLHRLKPVKNGAGNWVLERRYRFEFTSTGSQRYAGVATFVGRQFAGWQLPPYISPVADDEAWQDTPTLH